MTDFPTTPRRAVPSVDRCPRTGRARLSDGRAAELFSAANLDVRLHQPPHCALTHDAEDGTTTPIPVARPRHASVRLRLRDDDAHNRMHGDPE
jgi:hypothetical protein